MKKSCVLAYSGGLDTSVILGWLIDQGYAVHAVYVDLGQPCEDRQAVLEKAEKCGAASARIVDAQDEMCRDFAFPVLQFQAKYEGVYLLGTSIARPIISKCCLKVAQEVGATAYAHGATGKGNDQCRFQLAAEALNPNIEIIAPWRNENFRKTFPGRSEMIKYCEKKKIPVKASLKKPYSSDENCLHISYEAGILEKLDVCGIEAVEFGMCVLPQNAPDKVEQVSITFKSGVPIAVNEKKKNAVGIVKELNKIGGRNGIGLIDMVENRFVGMKSRGVYESPGMTILYDAHRYIEQLTLDRDLMHLRDRLAPEVAEMVYYGFWYHAKMDALLAFIREAQKPVDGKVVLNLYKGNIILQSRSSENSLYDEGIATMEGGGAYNQNDATGFLRIQSLPGRVQGKTRPRKF
ncbi:MAG: argininosuccinate synthase [Planctomycetaceae bacterium]|jgi:argininosuccinate synthase|nr:argininosuccinate synthase [Planctomycetaceae bacterium]